MDASLSEGLCEQILRRLSRVHLPVGLDKHLFDAIIFQEEVRDRTLHIVLTVDKSSTPIVPDVNMLVNSCQ
jgi:hypothetical protein